MVIDYNLLLWINFALFFCLLMRLVPFLLPQGRYVFLLAQKSNQKNGIFFFSGKKEKRKKAFKEVSLKILSHCGGFLWGWHWIFGLLFFFGFFVFHLDFLIINLFSP
ncbi:MAG: hypothetical protein R3Y27_06805 [Clostridia bacterium]